MSLSKFNADMEIIQKLDDEPNDVDGLTAGELKAKFDQGGGAVKAFLNGTLTAEQDAFNARTDNPHAVSKAQVGLGRCDDTADAAKPVSAPQRAALDQKADKTTTAAQQTQITALQTGKADKSNVLEKNGTDAFTPTADYQPATKKYTDETLAAAVLGNVPDGSITAAKLAGDAVTTNKVVNRAVTADKLADNAVTTIKLVNGSVTAAKLANGAVTPGSIGAFTKAETYTAATAALYPGGNSTPNGALSLLSEALKLSGSAVTRLNGSPIVLPAAQLDSRVRLATGVYRGTGTFGEANPNSVTCPFPIKVLYLLYWMHGTADYVLRAPIQGASAVAVMYDEVLRSTVYVKGGGISTNGLIDYNYGKKSPDGKTFSWYNTMSDQYQGNYNPFDYYWMAIGG